MFIGTLPEYCRSAVRSMEPSGKVVTTMFPVFCAPSRVSLSGPSLPLSWVWELKSTFSMVATLLTPSPLSPGSVPVVRKSL